MKKVIEVSIGRVNFVMEDEAYFQLKEYLKRFEATIDNKEEAREIMEDVEARVAEIFEKEIKYPNQVIGHDLVKIVIDHLGEVESNPKTESSSYNSEKNNNEQTHNTMGDKRLLRNPDEKMIAGVCSGLAAYLNIDVTIVRILFVVVFFCYGSALLAYIVIWIAAPEAKTVAQKLQMRGVAPTAENIRDYTNQYK